MIHFPEFDPGPEISVSASSFMAYRSCPEMALARFRGIYGPESMAAFRGNLAHRVFAHHLREGPIEPEEFGIVCRQEIGASNLNYKLGDLSMKPSALRATIAEVGALYERFRRMPGAGFTGAEEQLEAFPAAGVRLVGVIDAVFEESGTVRIVDWKTGALGEAARQLGFYALLWAEVKGSPPAIAEAVSVGTGERLELRPGLDDLTVVAHEVAEMVNVVRAALSSDTSLATVGGPWCEHCPLLEECFDGRAAVQVIQSSGGRRRSEE